ncbi:hypothetical protein DFP72DRAFT_848591 [Ephemerocybe angulata]|uniref:Uncharacterized protein n=1 Tax=Ephemerocybe angulata TaxID=980116 RepID=A0A8H6M5Q4_9AGAR|nr:hypothetical protein DFP72DRAFT_848591 [Tulosesus angulatus]
MSTLSTDSVSTHNTTAEDPTASKVEVSVAEMVRLESLLVAWRKDEHERQGGSVYLSAGIYLPPRQVGILADAAENFANMAKITVSAIRKLPVDSNLELEARFTLRHRDCSHAQISSPFWETCKGELFDAHLTTGAPSSQSTSTDLSSRNNRYV